MSRKGSYQSTSHRGEVDSYDGEVVKKGVSFRYLRERRLLGTILPLELLGPTYILSSQAARAVSVHNDVILAIRQFFVYH